MNTASAIRRYNSPNDTFNKSGIASEYNADYLIYINYRNTINNNTKDDKKVEETIDNDVSVDTSLAAKVEAESRKDDKSIVKSIKKEKSHV